MATMPSLTRTQAETRARLLTVHRYAVELDLTRGEETFGSTARITFAAPPGAETFAQIVPVTLRRAVLNGHELDLASFHDGVLPLTGLAAENELLVEADMAYSHTGEGLHRFTDPADGETYLYSQAFLDDVQRMFACFDQPDLKAVFDVTVTAPPAWTVLGNAVPTRSGKDGDGVWTFATTVPISPYLLTVAAGPYHSVYTEHAGLPFGLHCRRSLAPHLDADAAELFDITRRSFDHYARIFDEPYPFDSYDQAFVPEFNAGAMENPGLVTFRDEFLFRSAVTATERRTRAMVVAHEMAHMWFGDLVTLLWWDDIWLNESFAEYMGYQVISELSRTATSGWQTGDPWTEFAVVRKPWGYDADQRPSTHPVAPSAEGATDTSTALSNFDGISYAKGASAIRQLVARLGEKTFLAGVNDHITRHRFGNATLADFTDSLARAAGDRDVRGWADSWLRTTGMDTLTVTTAPAGEGRTRVTVERDGDRPHTLLVTPLTPTPEGTVLTAGTPLPFDVPGSAERTLDLPPGTLLLPNDQDLTYAKLRLDAASWQAVTEHLSAVPDALSRAVLWNTARDMVRDGDLPPADYLALVHRHLPAETDDAVAHGVLRFARGTVADCYLAPDDRDAALVGLSATARALRDRPGASEDVRLAALRMMIGSATAGPAAGELADWLETGTLPGGEPADAELRWQMLARLCALGAAGEERVAAELDHDPSATGRRAAARCRAALPTTEAKDAAWRALFEDDTLTNNLTEATATGFNQPGQAALLAPYAQRWCAAAADTAARRGPAISSALNLGFPLHDPSPAVLAAAEDVLAREDLLPHFRRQLADRLDDLRRTARIRGTE